MFFKISKGKGYSNYPMVKFSKTNFSERFFGTAVTNGEATVFEVADRAMVAVDYAAPRGRTFSQDRF